MHILIFSIFRKIFSYLCSYIIIIFIKKKYNKKPVLGFSNIYYNGNPKAVFEYLLKSSDKYEIIWAAKNRRSYKDVKAAGGNAFLIDGLLGLPHFLRVDIWFVAHLGAGNIPLTTHKKYKTIQLWHGAGSAKGMNLQKNDFESYDVWCTSSEYIKKRYVDLWHVPEDKIAVTGFARMDTLYNYLQNSKVKLLHEMNIKDGKILLYAPTYDIGLWPWGDEYKEFETLCKFCKNQNYILVLRLHPYARINKRKVKKIIKRYDNVYWLDMIQEPDTMKLLAVTDVLLTSWSSIASDYMITHRPIINLVDNKDYFLHKRGKPKLPLQYLPGLKVGNNTELYEELHSIFNTKKIKSMNYSDCLLYIHGNVDGKSSERVLKVIENLL